MKIYKVVQLGVIHYYDYNGRHHRLNGPAVIWGNGSKQWCLKGRLYSKTCHNKICLFSILEPRRFDISPLEECIGSSFGI